MYGGISPKSEIQHDSAAEIGSDVKFGEHQTRVVWKETLGASSRINRSYPCKYTCQESRCQHLADGYGSNSKAERATRSPLSPILWLSDPQDVVLQALYPKNGADAVELCLGIPSPFRGWVHTVDNVHESLEFSSISHCWSGLPQGMARPVAPVPAVPLKPSCGTCSHFPLASAPTTSIRVGNDLKWGFP